MRVTFSSESVFWVRTYVKILNSRIVVRTIRAFAVDTVQQGCDFTWLPFRPLIEPRSCQLSMQYSMRQRKQWSVLKRRAGRRIIGQESSSKFHSLPHIKVLRQRDRISIRESFRLEGAEVLGSGKLLAARANLAEVEAQNQDTHHKAFLAFVALCCVVESHDSLL